MSTINDEIEKAAVNKIKSTTDIDALAKKLRPKIYSEIEFRLKEDISEYFVDAFENLDYSEMVGILQEYITENLASALGVKRIKKSKKKKR